MHLTRSTLDGSALALLGALAAAPAAAQGAFVNFETPHVSPLALSADGTRLFAVNTPDAVLEVFDTSGPTPVLLEAIPVGLDPVSVRPRTPNEVWVVNHVSDSISVIDLTLGCVVRTIATHDEPADVVFAGSPARAFVTCCQTDEVLVFDPLNLSAAPIVIDIEGEEPRALAVSPDGMTVYAAVFESGNGSTILGGGIEGSTTLAFPNVVSDPLGPYGGVNPPPNAGTGFVPAIAPGLPVPPRVGLIVKKDAQGRWMDDNDGDWTDLVSGANASHSGRPVGWDVVDNDLVRIDTASLQVTYVTRLMNICMALGVNPTNGRVLVVGTDATNEVRFEPNVEGTFVRVNFALVSPAGGALLGDLNPHLDYSVATVPQATRDLSVGDPRGVAWNAAGTRAYVTGMGSNNVIVLGASGARIGAPIEVGEGPTGVALDSSTGRLYVLNKFASSISTIDVATTTETSRVSFHDASPTAIREGRKHLYDTHERSGLGQAACASCHVDGRMDRLAWDLGNPAGAMASNAGQNLGMNIPGLTAGFTPFHPMKGPMTTQTLQDIIGKEPLHWRGDRNGIEDFNPAFEELQGDDVQLTTSEMQEFEDFLATLYFQPNPNRNFDNSLPTSVSLEGFHSAGRFSPAGTPLPDGNAQLGLNRYVNTALDGALRCVTCHTLPTGLGPDMRFVGGSYVPIAPGLNGERHHGLVSVDGSTQRTIKIAQLRNEIEKNGFSVTQLRSRAGFGVLHDGSIPGLPAFLSSPASSLTSDQDLANMVAFMLSLTGSELPQGSPTNILVPPGTASNDVHAGVGVQTTLVDFAAAPAAQTALLFAMLNQANTGRIGLTVKGLVAGEHRGYALFGSNGMFQSDRAGEVVTFGTLFLAAAPGSEHTWTMVPTGSETRLGIDRDLDSYFDRDELDAGSDPADPASVPVLGTSYCGPGSVNSAGTSGSLHATGSPVVSSNDLRLTASDLPPNQFAFFLNSITQGLTPNPGGSQGNLCLGGAIGRYNGPGQILNSGAGGVVSLVLDLTSTPTPTGPVAILGGTTWNFQAWYRDQNPTSTSNFTDAVSVDFQ